MHWIRLYTNYIMTGTTFLELDAEARGLWFSYLVLAGYSQIHGQICITEGVPYTQEQLSKMLRLPLEVIERGNKILQEVNKITIEDGIIKIVNWNKYQTEYLRKKELKEKLEEEKVIEKKPKVKQKKIIKPIKPIDPVPEPELEPKPKNSNDPFDVTYLEEQAKEQVKPTPVETKSIEVKTSEFIKTYCEEYKKRYQKYPIVTGKIAGVAERMVNELGLENSKTMIKAYINMNDQWFITKTHDLPTFEANLNKISLNTTGSQDKAKDKIIRDKEGNVIKIIKQREEPSEIDITNLTKNIGKEF